MDNRRTYYHPFFGHRHSWKRRFFTEEELKEMKARHKEMTAKWMEHYKESLEKELKGVTERLEQLKK